jgi:hypothetical protein
MRVSGDQKAAMVAAAEREGLELSQWLRQRTESRRGTADYLRAARLSLDVVDFLVGAAISDVVSVADRFGRRL